MSIARNIAALQSKIYLHILCLCLPLILCLVSQANESANLSLHSDVYSFIKRIDLKYPLQKRLYNTQPLTHHEIAEALIDITTKHLSGQIEMTDVEVEHLEKYQWLFGDEIEAIKPGFLTQTARKHTVSVKKEDYKADFDFRVKQEAVYTKENSKAEKGTSVTSTDFIFRVKLSQHLGFSTILHDRLLLGSADSYNPYEREVAYDLEGESRTLNAMEGYIVFHVPWLSVQWGLDEIWWGPGWHGALMISDNSAPKDTLKITSMYGPLKFTYLTAILREEAREYQSKYMSAHRLEFLPYPGISIGLNEVMVFADRYELRYLNPFIIFYTLQTEDSANNGLLGFDLDITLLPSIELYTELMIDDFQTQKGLDAFHVWNSKYGILGGMYWSDPFKLRNTDIRLEYAFVNQFAYTHRYQITRYTHEDFVIGHWIGTDADDLWFDVKHWFNDKFQISLTYEMERHGEGDVTKRHPIEIREVRDAIDSPENWEFLSGVAESKRAVSLGFSYTSIGKYSAGIKYKYSRTRNVNNEPRIDGKEHQLLLEAEYRF